MAKITRKNMKVFGSSATANQRAVFGSLNAGSPAYSSDPETIQSLSNYLSGWFAAVEGGNSPAIEDMNALQFLYAYQLAYILQQGIAEWNALTTYYQGSIVTLGDTTGRMYVSLTDNNLNNSPATDTANTNWRDISQPSFDEFLSDGTWAAPTGVTSVKVNTYTFLFNQLASTNGSALAINSTGSAYAWGSAASGYTGNGGPDSSSPILVLGGFKWRQITCGGGVLSSGDAYMFGQNANGNLGTGNVTASSSPVLVLGGFKYRMLAAINQGHTVGIIAAGDAYAWGLNGNGQLGLGDVIPRSSPVIVLGGKKWRQIAAGGGNQSYGIDSNGDLYAWGANQAGGLGVGDVIPRSSPVLVLGGLKWKTIVTDVSTITNGWAIGITSTDDMYAFGANASGQLGLGDVVSRSSPVIVLGGLKWKNVSAAAKAVVAITTGGDAYAWGFNPDGNLGTGDVIPRSSPVAVLGGFKWRRVCALGSSVSHGSAIGITTGCVLYSWGYNVSGQLGLGDVVPRSSPVLVLGGFNYPAVYEILVNSVNISVTPGASYNVAVYGLLAMFNYAGLYQDPYASGAMPIRMTVEYT